MRPPVGVEALVGPVCVLMRRSRTPGEQSHGGTVGQGLLSGPFCWTRGERPPLSPGPSLCRATGTSPGPVMAPGSLSHPDGGVVATVTRECALRGSSPLLSGLYVPPLRRDNVVDISGQTGLDDQRGGWDLVAPHPVAIRPVPPALPSPLCPLAQGRLDGPPEFTGKNLHRGPGRRKTNDEGRKDGL